MSLDSADDTSSKPSPWRSTMAKKWPDAQLAYDKLGSRARSSISPHIFIGDLWKEETFWAAHQPYLLSRGYQLRPRYRPEWIPSWKDLDNIKNLRRFEDAIESMSPDVLDAIRVSDEFKVVMKRVDTQDEEIHALHYLYSPQLACDPRNNTVPLIDVIPLPNNPTKALIVMPQLYPFATLPFRRLGEFLEAADQFLEGLDFMHQHRIAHMDACYHNLMMDASKMIPRGFHQIHPHTHDGVSAEFIWNDRWSVRPNRYYFIDFNLAHYYPEDVQFEEDTTMIGQDETVPEFRANKPYNPFKLDVYQLGNVFLGIIKKFDGLEVLLPIAEAMTRMNPDDRPTALEALRMLHDLQIKSDALVQSIWPKDVPLDERQAIELSGSSSYSTLKLLPSASGFYLDF
ncbi:hypothetical protein H0H93_013853 [Arthromyces matolae]|nr:hypothetical protein H0H93_013853 [Arthromyces matolae]